MDRSVEKSVEKPQDSSEIEEDLPQSITDSKKSNNEEEEDDSEPIDIILNGDSKPSQD